MHRTLVSSDTSVVHVSRLVRFIIRRTDEETEALRGHHARKIVSHGTRADGTMFFEVLWQDGTTSQESATSIHRLAAFKDYVSKKDIAKSRYTPRTAPPAPHRRARNLPRATGTRGTSNDSDSDSSDEG